MAEPAEETVADREQSWRRRHNRHFHLEDDLTRCSGATTFYFYRCSNWGKPSEDGTYWCHVHLGQQRFRTETSARPGEEA